MPFDLFRGDLSSVTAGDLYKVIRDFIRIDEPKENRPREGYLLDYKSEWGEKALKTVAAFANTFGGILIVGVAEDDAYPKEIIGIKGKGELKTRIVSAITTSLHPCPFFEVGECFLPSDQSLKLAVLRVRSAQEVCLVTKKGLDSNPIYVRVEDQSAPANAAQVTALFERRAQERSGQTRQLPNLMGVLGHFYVVVHDSTDQNESRSETRSETYFLLIAQPHSMPRSRVDMDFDMKFHKAVFDNFRGFSQRSNLVTEIHRDSSSVEIVSWDMSKDYQMRWRASSDGQVMFVTQLRENISGQEWSLYDIVAHTVYFLRMVREFWSASNYYGAATIALSLNVGALHLLHSEGFPALFYDPWKTRVQFPVSSSVFVSLGRVTVRTLTDASLTTGYRDLTEDALDESVSDLLNQLLRGQGYGVRFDELRKAVKDF